MSAEEKDTAAREKETFSLTGLDQGAGSQNSKETTSETPAGFIDEEVAEMLKLNESTEGMTEHMVEEVETKIADDDAMLARRLSEAKRLAESAKNENDLSSARSGASSRRTSFTFDMPKFVEDSEKDDEDKGEEDVDTNTHNLESIAETEYDIEPDNMSESHRDRAPPLRNRYFGPEARIMFYDRLRFLYKQRYNMVYDKDHEIEDLYFDNEDQEKLDYPFVQERQNVFDEKKEGADGVDDDLLSALTGDMDSLAGKTRWSGATGKSGKSYKSAYADEFPDPGDTLACPVSPRTKFIAGCVKERMNPRASLILRKRLGKSVNISHMCIGNEVARLLADCLGDMPFVESLNINNNNLTDEGVAAILEAIKPITTLKHLDISRNKMDDDAADALASYVQQEDCPCESLVMQVSDVDDFEGERFVRCLMNNRSITEIDLSDNLLGRAEVMRTVVPGMCTCTEAFAQMLEAENCILKKLTLAWNTIRLESCISLCRSLRGNQSLTYLDFSYNSLSHDGGEALGDALLENEVLQHLNIASNAINSSACFTISMGVIENKALNYVCLDNNPIGSAGAAALMLVPINVGSRCKISAEKCNTGLSDSMCWFSHSNPLGMHKLDLSKPYERAVAFALIHLVANHATYIFVQTAYEPSAGAPQQDLKLFQTVLTDTKEKFFDARQRQIVEGLKKMRDAAGNRENGIALFHEADEDGGGSIDGEELTALLESVGMDVTPDMIDDILDVYDLDGEGAIGLPEFLAFLRAQYNESVTRLAEMTEERIMAQPSKPNEKYKVPRTGFLHLMVMDGFTRKEKYSVINSCDQDYAKEVSSGDASNMLSFALSNSKIRFGEAMTMFNTMYGEGGQKAYILADLVVKLADPRDCKKLVQKVTRGDKTQINLLKQAMMGCYKPYLGILNGYYQLDLSKKMDRIALTRLLEQSQTDNTRRQAFSSLSPGRMGDTSQCGNWTSFRNEFLNGKRYAIHPDRFRPMPEHGKLCFDYCMTSRPTINDDFIILSDKRLVKMLYNIFLVKEEDMPRYLKMLEMWQKDLKKNNVGRGAMKPKYEYDKEKGLAIGHAVRDFYENLDSRRELHSEGFMREVVKVGLNKQEKKKKRGGKKKKREDALNEKPVDTPSVYSQDSPETLNEKPVDTPSVYSQDSPETKEEVKEDNATSSAKAGADTGEGKEEEKDKGEDKEDKEDKEEQEEGEEEEEEEEEEDKEEEHKHIKRDKKLNEEMAKYKTLIESPLVQDEAKAARIVEMMEDLFAHVWILSRHLAALVVSFPCGSSGRTDYFGSYHVDLVVSLFNRVVDVHNFEVVMSVLNPQECAQVYCRIGWLNIFNPMKPEGYWVVDFNRYEERMVGKMLIGLAIIEPGDNWKDSWFRWSWDMDYVPGWELTEGYTKDETLTLKGICHTRYYSGRGRGLEGCVAHVTFRKAMFSLVLADEQAATMDLDEKFPYLSSHEDDDDSEDDNEKLPPVDDGSIGSMDSMSSLKDDSNIPDVDPHLPPHLSGRALLPGEKWLKNNTSLWDTLFAPAGGVAEKTKKNPLALIFMSGIQEEGNF